MLNLIRNEYQKIFCKVGTYVMLAIILVSCIGFQFILKTGTTEYYWEPTREDIQYEYEYYCDIVNDNPEYIVERDFYKAMLDFEIYDADMYGNTQSWQGEALNSAYREFYYAIHSPYAEEFDTEYKEKCQVTFDALIQSIKENDYSKFCQAVVDSPLDENDQTKLRCSTAQKMNITPDDWGYSLLDKMMTAVYTMNSYRNVSEEDRDDAYYKAKDTYELINYRIANDIRYCVTLNGTNDDYDIFTGGTATYSFSSDCWSNVYNSTGLITAVTIMIVIIAGGIFASEFSQGTIKFLLINPVTRRKIFFSKYITVMSLTALLSAAVFGVCVLSNVIMGSEGINAAYLTIKDGKVVSESVLGIVITPYLLALVQAVIIITLAFMISGFMRNSALAIGISVGILLAGNTITSILAMLGFDFARYFVFANTGLNAIMSGNSMFPHHSLTFAVINLVVHWFVLLLIAYDGFTRKEV